MAKDDQLTGGAKGRDLRFWNALADHWFEDLPDDEQLGLAPRWSIAGFGVATYFLAYVLVESERVLSAPPQAQFGLLLMGSSFIVGLGFLLAWKRPRTGPVRLFVSGVALPSFILLAAHTVTSIGE